MALVATIKDFQSNRFYLFLICKSQLYFLPRFKSIGFLIQERNAKWIFKIAAGFPIGMILAIFDVQIALILLTDFLAEETKSKIDV